MHQPHGLSSFTPRLPPSRSSAACCVSKLPAARISNILDDSILPELRDNGGDIAAIAPRWEGYARTARALGADLILNACLSIGELCAPVEQALGLPVVRVDAALAREAIQRAGRGGRVAVVATLQSTLV
jgi:hypothetical protein